jgi:rSAM/selenodomain-associated transferase 2
LFALHGVASAGHEAVWPTPLEVPFVSRAPHNNLAAQFSVIIPTWNEAGYLPRAIASARRNRAGEILVVDGGSTDATVEIARELADRVFVTVRGRASQMNCGARHARGEFLCFLHADCCLGPNALMESARLLERPEIAGGCFRQRHDISAWQYRWLDAAASARLRLFGLAYGDQGFFVRRDVFLQLGGFPDVPIFEDALLWQKLSRHGKLALARSTILVSARRWQQNGFWHQLCRNGFLACAFLLGVPPHALAGYY